MKNPQITITQATVNGIKRPDLVRSNYDMTAKGCQVLAGQLAGMFEAAYFGKQAVTIDRTQVTTI